MVLCESVHVVDKMKVVGILERWENFIVWFLCTGEAKSGKGEMEMVSGGFSLYFSVLSCSIMLGLYRNGLEFGRKQK